MGLKPRDSVRICSDGVAGALNSEGQSGLSGRVNLEGELTTELADIDLVFRPNTADLNVPSIGNSRSRPRNLGHAVEVQNRARARKVGNIENRARANHRWREHYYRS